MANLIDPALIEILRCPENRTRLHLADEALVSRINEGIAGGAVKNKLGQPLTAPIEGGLVREDRAVLYPITDGIPVLLVDEGIPLDQVTTD